MYRELKDYQVPSALKVKLVKLEIQDLLDHLDLLVLVAERVALVTKDPLDLLDLKGNLYVLLLM